MAGSRMRRFFARFLAFSAVLCVVAGLGFAGFVYWVFLRDLPDLRSLEDFEPMLTSTVVDREGRPIGEFFEERRTLIGLDELPPLVIQAFLAAEDDTFYEHSGVDYVSIARAAWANFQAGGEAVQGASTITQQTVKRLLLSPERTYRRKIRELILARRLEQHFTKDEILYLYLNEIYFGSGAYGVQEAARTYFGKTAPELGAGEAALLAGLPKAPTRNSPFQNPERAEERRLYVLSRMREEGFLEAAAYQEAVATRPVLAGPPEAEDFATAAYFTEEVRKILVEALGNDVVLRGGLRIETTLDLGLQREAVRSVREGLRTLDRRQGYRGPLRQVEPGGIEQEVARLAETNALGADPEAELPTDRWLEGVVTEVAAKRAKVAFGPGIERGVRHEEVKWARPFDTSRPAHSVSSVDRVFSVGDVAAFEVVRSSGAEGEPDVERVHLRQTPVVQGALLSLSIDAGEVLAMVGGYDFEASEFNRAVQAERQPGSAFKPLVYAAALGRGFTPASILHDRPVVYDDGSGETWRPQNYGRKFLGPITMRESLARSVNNATIHLMADVGVDYVVRFARRVGLRASLEPNLSLALGSNPVSLLELLRAYAVFPNEGRPVRTRFVVSVLDRKGEPLLEQLDFDDGVWEKMLEEPEPEEPDALVAEAALREPPVTSGPEDFDRIEPPEPAYAALPPIAGGRVVPAAQAFLATDLLRGVVEHPRGTGGRARKLGHPLGGKTGTTNAQGDAWFMGFSADVATGVWVGFDSKEVLGRGETGGRAALPIWIDFMGVALEEAPVHDFEAPEEIVFARIDPKSGKLAAPGSEGSYYQPFLRGTVPATRADASVSDEEQRQLERLDF